MTHKNDFDDAFPQERQIGGSHYKDFFIQPYEFIAKNDLPFSLISDESKEVLNAYGVWGPKKFMGRTFDGIHRTTFVIDENGMIKDIITKIKTKAHTSQILESK